MKTKNNINPSRPAPSPEEIYDFLVKNDMISLDDVKNVMRKQKEKEVLQNHPYSISQGKDGRWRTWVKDATAKGGRRKIAKATEEALVETLIEHYDGHDENGMPIKQTIRDLYPDWLHFKELHTSAETYISRIQTDWKKYYENDPIVDVPVRHLKKITLDEWAHKLIKEHRLTKNAYYNITVIMRQCLHYAVDLELIAKSPFDDVRLDSRRVFRVVHKKKSATQVYTSEEVEKIFRCAWDNFYNSEKLVYRLSPLAVIFQFLTGLRVGELDAVRFDDMDHGVLTVSRMHRRDTKEIVDHTKTYEDREVLLPDPALEIIKIAKEYQKKNSGAGIYIFSMTNEPLKYGEINELLKRYCAKERIPYRSSHKARKTYISTLIDAGVNIDAIRELVGHADERTTYASYCFDRTPDAEKKRILNEALAGK